MKRLIIFSFSSLAVFAAGSVRAQSLEAFKQRLAQPVWSEAAESVGNARGAQVVATEYGDAARVVAEAARTVHHRSTIKGYRVCIFADNGQDARARADVALSLFRESYPGIPGYKVYDAPYFRVTVGDCLTAEEAIILKGRVAGIFPKAFPKSEELTLHDFSN